MAIVNGVRVDNDDYVSDTGGWAEFGSPKTLEYFNKTYGTNFQNDLDYLQYLYGVDPADVIVRSGADLRGEGLDTAMNANYYKLPEGYTLGEGFVNQPLSYDPVDFTDKAWMLPLGVAGLGFADMGGLFGDGGLSGLFGGGDSAIADIVAAEGGWSGLPSYGMDFSGLTGAADAAWGANLRPDSLASMQEIDGSMQTIYDAMASAGAPGYSPALASTSLGSGFEMPSWLKSILPDGTTLPKLVGTGLQTALGIYGANQQANAYGDMFDKYYGMGAPYRDLLLKSYQPGFDIGNEPGFKNAMDTAFNTYMRAASAGNAQGVASGNPFDNPGALMESQKYLLGNLALPYLQNYRSGLSSSGQLGIEPSAQLGSNKIQAQGGVYDAIGYGIDQVFNPQPDYMKKFANLMTPKLNSGGLV